MHISSTLLCLLRANSSFVCSGLMVAIPQWPGYHKRHVDKFRKSIVVLLEHPSTSRSWLEESFSALAHRKDTYSMVSHLCLWGFIATLPGACLPGSHPVSCQIINIYFATVFGFQTIFRQSGFMRSRLLSLSSHPV